VLVIAALASLTYAIIEGNQRGWTSPEILGLFALALISFVVLIWHELHRPEPLIEMRFFRSAPFSGASAIAVCAFASLAGFLFLTTLYLQGVRGLSPLHAGLYLLPTAGMTLVFSPLSGRIIGKRGGRLPLLVSGCALTFAALMLTRLTPTTPTAYLLLSFVLFGLGFGLVNPPITNTAVSGMPPSQAGVAAGIASTSRQVGATLGVAIVGAVAGGGLASVIGKGFAVATRPAWWILAALGAVILVLGFLTTSAWAQATAERTADRFREAPSDSGQSELGPGAGERPASPEWAPALMSRPHSPRPR
jgi:MFS family permease